MKFIIKRLEHISETLVRLNLPYGFALGFGAMTAVPTPWYCWDRYVWFERYSNHVSSAWHVRILWVYFGRETKKVRSADIQSR